MMYVTLSLRQFNYSLRGSLYSTVRVRITIALAQLDKGWRRTESLHTLLKSGCSGCEVRDVGVFSPAVILVVGRMK